MKRNAKHTATISLGIMGAGFAATFPVAHLPFGAVLQSGFEAGLVGGLADWFAVTALFRHPLGIPIPHTALLPKNREKVTNALVNAIQSNLLHKESIIEKMKGARIAEKLLNLVKHQLETEAAAGHAAALCKTLLARLSPGWAADAVSPVVRNAIRGLDAEALLRQTRDALLQQKYEEPVFDYILAQGERIAAGDVMRQRMGAMAARSLEQLQMGGLMGFAVNAFAGFMNEDKLGSMIQGFLLTTLAEMRSPDHPYRRAALDAFRSALNGLPDNPAVLREAEALKARLADGGHVREAVEDGIHKLLAEWSERLSDPSFHARHTLSYGRKGIDYVLSQPQWVAAFDGWIQEQAGTIVERNHGIIGKLVKENADKLDNDALIAMMEQHIGKDIQWIRVNGALCGFAIGIVLGLIQLAVH